MGVVTASSSAARQRFHDCGLQQHVGSPLAATYHLCCGVQVGPPLSRCPALLPGVVLSMYLPAHAPAVTAAGSAGAVLALLFRATVVVLLC